jgi:hypothetical protein
LFLRTQNDHIFLGHNCLLLGDRIMPIHPSKQAQWESP